MKADDLEFSLAAVNWIVMAILAVYTWISNRHSATTQDQTELDKRLTEKQALVEQRVAILETQMEGVPTQQQLTEVIERLAHVDARLEGVLKQIDPLLLSLQRINDYLLNNK